MMPALRQRYLVTGHDFAPWQAIVEADSLGDAIAKAEALYLADGAGSADICAAGSSGVNWNAMELVQGVRS